jgi:hypothetical protein
MNSWLNDSAPKDSKAVMQMLPTMAMRSLTKGVDISQVKPDIFTNPERYSPQVKAAVMFDLLDRQNVLHTRRDLWHQGQANDRGLNINFDKFSADVAKKIQILANDPDTMKFITDNRSAAIQNLVSNNPGLRASLESYKKTQYDTGLSLKNIMESEVPALDQDGKQIKVKLTPTEAVRQFASETATLEASGVGGVDAVTAQKSLYNLDRNTHDKLYNEGYLKDVVGAQTLKQEMAAIQNSDGKNTEFIINGVKKNATALTEAEQYELQQQASAKYKSTVAAYTSVFGYDRVKLDADQINKNGIDASLNNITHNDFKAAFFNSDGTINQDRLNQLRASNPEFFNGPDGKPLPSSAIMNFINSMAVSAPRATWKFNDAFNKAFDAHIKGGYANKLPVNDAYKGGYFHALGALFGGITLAMKGIQAGGKNPTPKDIADGVAGTVGQLGMGMDGYAKNVKYLNENYMKDVNDRAKAAGMTKENLASKTGLWDPKNKQLKAEWDTAQKKAKYWESFGNFGKIAGGAASGVGGMFSILAGEKMINTDPVGAGLNITSGSLALVSMVAGVGEGWAGLAGASTRVVGAFGMLGGVAADAGLLVGVGLFLYDIIGKAVAKAERGEVQRKYYDQVSEMRGKYGIDGGPTDNNDWYKKEPDPAFYDTPWMAGASG